MKRINRITALTLSAAVVFSTLIFPVKASTWVTVSSWAYTDVSSFKKEGLLPESFEDISDYTLTISRMEFAELVFSVLEKTGNTKNYEPMYEFDDTDSATARTIADYGIMLGEDTGVEKEWSSSGSKMKIHHAFYPERELTREETAAVLARAVSRCAPSLMGGGRHEYETPSDYGEISDWAKDSVESMTRCGIISGMDDGTFAPRSSLTIEQAISLLYRLYGAMPAVTAADGADIHGGGLVYSYGNGVEEVKNGGLLCLVMDGETLMELETDIYANVYCALSDGKYYVAAQNFYGKTDVYDLLTKELLFKLPHAVYAAEGDCIITKSASLTAVTYGIYGYDGTEIAPPVYSLEEIDEIISGGFTIPEPDRAEADGVVFYANESDEGRLYRIGTDGGGKKKISDMPHCADIAYVNGRVYFTAQGTLFTITADGSDKRILSTAFSHYVYDSHNEWRADSMMLDGYYDFANENGADDERVLCDGKWLYYSVNAHSKNEIHRVSVTGDKIEDEKISGGLDAVDVQYKDGALYFKDYTGWRKRWEEYFNGTGKGEMDYSSPLWRFDGERLESVSEKMGFDVLSYGFIGSELVMLTGTDDINSSVYIADADGSNARVMDEINDVMLQNRVDGIRDIDLLVQPVASVSDGKFTVYNVNDWRGGNDVYTLIRGADGSESRIDPLGSTFIKRVGDTLYYKAFDESGSGILCAFDMESGEKTVAAHNVHTIMTESTLGGGDYVFYKDHAQNVWRFGCGEGELCEIYPNGGSYSGGETVCVVSDEDGLYTIDKRGKYLCLTDDKSYSYTFVGKEQQ